eukprot:gnl/TRDRNA2_/TRDRNA2_156868_c0_seq1.p1 gnl/TRDRNA2_/TRDRNA2_156868_c0~~gnl/TRDRNA2_/TRDRNA2_156868_c0_seq1.p1  ORF type:complete len:245 (-),score=52.80 gnl/TRDRNA2_/TRDRNA2_156868_c0_seq1:80-721(-)
MATSAMTLLRVNPEDKLVFTPQGTKVNLSLTNISSGSVAFKVKTTAPKSYLVRPSSGTLKAGESQNVEIIRTEGAAANHRFLVQAVAVSDGQAVTREQWADFHKDQLQEQRLNVALEEDGATATAAPKPTTAATGANFAAGGDSSLKMKYDELVQYTLMLEKEKKKLEADVEAARSSQSTAVSSGGGYSKMHVILVALISFLLSYVAKFVTDK